MTAKASLQKKTKHEFVYTCVLVCVRARVCLCVLQHGGSSSKNQPWWLRWRNPFRLLNFHCKLSRTAAEKSCDSLESTMNYLM